MADSARLRNEGSAILADRDRLRALLDRVQAELLRGGQTADVRCRAALAVLRNSGTLDR